MRLTSVRYVVERLQFDMMMHKCTTKAMKSFCYQLHIILQILFTAHRHTSILCFTTNKRKTAIPILLSDNNNKGKFFY